VRKNSIFTPTLSLPHRGGGNFLLYFKIFTLSPGGRGEGKGGARGKRPESP